MRNLITTAFTMLFVFCSAAMGQENEAHYLHFQNAKALHHYFRYNKKVPVIIQGHRGGRENSLPESSIAEMKYVLTQMTAIFEIDPRYTKDSVIVVFHDPKLDRTTNGSGKVSDYTWAELQKLNLKNSKGEITPYKIPTLIEVLDWARGKTVLILDKKDIPLDTIANIIAQKKANNYVINMVRSTDEALVYYNKDHSRMLSVSIHTPEEFKEYMKAGIPATQIFACIGTKVDENTADLCKMLKKKGIRCLIATSTSYDKIKNSKARADAYREVAKSGATMIESNFPVEVSRALSAMSGE